MNRILIAGIGNIFNGDDAFGVTVAQNLAERGLPENVNVVDFGIRGIDLTYALLDGFDAAVLVDAVQQGGPPGTLYVIEPESQAAEAPQPEDLLFSPHEMDPAKVLRTVAAMGGRCRRIVLVGCEPAMFDDEYDGAMGLSAPVAAAVDSAVEVIEELVGDLMKSESMVRKEM